MKSLCRLSLLFLLPFGLMAQSVTIGWLPYTNPLKLLKIHKPYREYLQKELGEKVTIVSAKGYKAFHEATVRGDYDLIITGPHFGSLAIRDGFIPLYKYRTRLKPLFVIRKGSPLKQAEDLRDKTLALSGMLSVSTAGGLGWLGQNGMEAEKDFKVLVSSSHPSAIHAVIIGEADAAVTTMTPIRQLAPDLLNKIDYFEAPVSLPHLFTIANPKLSEKRIARLKEVLGRFEQTQEGKAYFEKTGYLGYVPIEAKDTQAMAPLLPTVQKQLTRD